MLELNLLTFQDLLDLLTEQTAYHTQLIASGANDEQKNTSRNILIELQSEIAIRKMADAQKENTQNDSITFTAD